MNHVQNPVLFCPKVMSTVSVVGGARSGLMVNQGFVTLRSSLRQIFCTESINSGQAVELGGPCFKASCL